VYTLVYALHRIIIAPSAQADLDALRPFDRNRVVEAMGRSLHHGPDVPSTHRKMLSPHPRIEALGVAWELRVGEFRVYYRIGGHQVIVLMVRRKGRRRTEEIL
jgi:mRNA-degrading endonuclease RelE of RelBE toxin-antitoxin system